MDENMEKRIEAEIKLEDFPASFRHIVSAIGVAAAIELSKASGGLTQYVPKYDALAAPARDRIILEEFTGFNFRELAIRYNLSEIWIRQIVDKDKADKAQEEYRKNQTSLDFSENGQAS